MTTKETDWRSPRAAYIHIPFCAHHCGYCDFAVTAGQDQLIDLYLDAMDIEFMRLKEPQARRTIFVGGGTPTYLKLEQLDRFLTAVNRWFPRLHRDEFSIESTPDSLSPDKIALMKSHGISRISIGVQSFDTPSLKSLDRIHDREQIPLAVEWVKEAGLDVSLDLIFGAPGSTLATWNDDLSMALSLKPDHISTYGLTYEKGTPLWKQRKAGLVLPIAEENELAMYELAINMIDAAGFEHYEVSNFAMPGKRCQHNEIYWANHAHDGLGVGAAAYVDGVRTLNIRNTADYIARLKRGESPVFQSEQLNDRERAFETIGVQIRRSQGIEFIAFHHQTGFDLTTLVGPAIERLQGYGLIVCHEHGIRLTRKGYPLADSVIVELLKG